MEIYTCILRQRNFGVFKMLVWYLLDHARLSSDCMTAINGTETLIEVRFFYIPAQFFDLNYKCSYLLLNITVFIAISSGNIALHIWRVAQS